MILFLFCVWLLLNGIFAWNAAGIEMYILGAVLCLAIGFFMVRCMDYSPQNDWYLVRNAGLLLACLGILVKDIVAANLAVGRLILRGQGSVQPKVVRQTVPLKKRLSHVMLANYITLTPGTVTVDVTGDEFTVHCLDSSLLADCDRCAFVRMLRRMEEHA